jgi:hypothetical protein
MASIENKNELLPENNMVKMVLLLKIGAYPILCVNNKIS